MERRGSAARSGVSDRLFDKFYDFLRALIGNQPQADFCDGARGNHSLGTFAGEASADSMDFERRARPHSFEQWSFGFTGQRGRSNLCLSVLFGIERKTAPCGKLGGSRL